MSDPGTFCSDCAWPYECARESICRRRDQGDIRASDHRGTGLKPATVTIEPLQGFNDDVAEIHREFQKAVRHMCGLDASFLRGRA